MLVGKYDTLLEETMNSKFVFITLLLASFLVGCNLASPVASSTPVPSDTPTLEFNQPTSPPVAITTSVPPSTIVTLPCITPLSVDQAILQEAAEVVAALKDKDMAALSRLVHPQMGLRFSPYAAVKASDQLFTPDRVAGLLADNTTYTWGAYDGSGATIELTFADYYAKFVYDEDFANPPQLALNHRLGVSTTLDNSTEFYPGSMIVEYYFPGFDPQYEGMDWRSLRLVFMQDENTWYLMGIIHDQWTT
jgi:hypothetical protein